MSNAERVLWVTGAGSGMGRAAAVAAAGNGWRVALSGRRAESLAETARLVDEAGGASLVLPMDTRDAAAIRDGHATIKQRWSAVTDLVLSAGLNTPARYWRDQKITEFGDVVATNLTGVAAMIDAALPDLRGSAGGHVVVVSSYAAWRFSPHSGVAYAASKTALVALCAMLNEQEAPHGIRACHLCPGEVATDFLDLRPSVPDAEARAVMLTPDDVARAVLFVLESPPHVRIDELVISPVAQH
ncbi:MAG TPA: SDR family NAD(P)-dependent oxidoreductase [Propionibacteriaceae bacterium]|jgi:NADP-dependent 3-hydroxy acid dehydrogenase YdfG|nr:SDR family NAD(P)-dependent oxidoreductase [Propionibacteriaceae bacterium]